MKNNAAYFAVLGLAAVLCGCAAGDDRFPSLALRPAETGTALVADDSAVPIRSQTAPATAPAAIAALRERAARAHSAFTAQETAVTPLARQARGQGIETNARANALAAMAVLTSRRGATSAVLADIDLLAAQSATTLGSDPSLAALQAEVAALLTREDAGIAQLWNAMGS